MQKRKEDAQHSNVDLEFECQGYEWSFELWDTALINWFAVGVEKCQKMTKMPITVSQIQSTVQNTCNIMFVIIENRKFLYLKSRNMYIFYILAL